MNGKGASGVLVARTVVLLVAPELGLAQGWEDPRFADLIWSHRVWCWVVETFGRETWNKGKQEAG